MPRRTLPFLTLTITWWLSLVPAGWAQQDGQDTGVDGAPGPIVARAARAPDSHRLKRNYAHTPVALTITLPPITRAQQAASTETEEPERPGPLQIGFGRDMPDTDRGDLAPRLAWETQSDGSQVSALSVSSPGARAVRVALRGTLPTGAEVRFFSPADPEQRFPPVQPADVSPGLAAETPAGAPAEESAPLWSPVVEGDTVGVEISLPSPAAVSDVSLFIDRVSHLSASVRQATPQRRSDIGDAASCHIDVACRTTTPRNLAAATAKMIYTKSTGGSFLCTGVLLNDTDGSSSIPYFLTANHCINTQTVARTLDTYWEFERASCGGVAPSRVNQLTGGADLLATDPGTDSTLLRLREVPLADTWYAGWDPQPLPYPTEVIGIHHPQGDLKKWSRGRAVRNTTTILRDENQRVSAIRVEWTEGTVERGSSGSGLFDTRGRLRGVLSGTPVGQTACGLGRNTSYGRFDLFYPRVSRWLAPASGPSDHGDTRAEATSLQPDTEEVGDLDRSGDVDYFRIEVPEAGRLTVETTGPTNTVGYLQDAQGQPLAEDDNTGADDNFRIVRKVPAGTYYVGVVGAPHRPADDHGNTAEEATGVGLDSTTAGVLERGGDVDYFRVTVTRAGTLTIETSGTTDTKGSLLRATGTTLAENEDAGAGDNFRIVQQVAAGTYYVAVRGYDADETGSYTLRVRVRFAASPPISTNLRSLLGTWQFTYRIISTFTRTYRLSQVVTTTGIPLISGTDEYGALIIAGRIQDIRPGTNLPYDYALLDDGIFLCSFYLFNKIGSDAVRGLHYVIHNGDCSGSSIFDPNPMTGRRISLSTLSESDVLRSQMGVADQERAELQLSEAKRSLKGRSTSRAFSLEEGANNSIADIVQALSRQLEKHK